MFILTIRLHVIAWDLAVLQDAHDYGTTSVGTSVLGQVVTAGELLAAFMAFEWLVLGVERSIMALEVFLATESTIAFIADKGLGWVFSERLLAAAAVDWCSVGSARVGAHDTVGGVMLGRTRLTVGDRVVLVSFGVALLDRCS